VEIDSVKPTHGNGTKNVRLSILDFIRFEGQGFSAYTALNREVLYNGMLAQIQPQPPK